MRWRLKLEEYDIYCIYKIIHKADKGITNADALSRNPIWNDEHVHNIQAEKREDDTKEDKEAPPRNIRKKRNKYYMNISTRKGASSITNDKKNKIVTW